MPAVELLGSALALLPAVNGAVQCQAARATTRDKIRRWKPPLWPTPAQLASPSPLHVSFPSLPPPALNGLSGGCHCWSAGWLPSHVGAWRLVSTIPAKAKTCPQCALWHVQDTFSRQYAHTARDRAFTTGPLMILCHLSRKVNTCYHYLSEPLILLPAAEANDGLCWNPNVVSKSACRGKSGQKTASLPMSPMLTYKLLGCFWGFHWRRLWEWGATARNAPLNDFISAFYIVGTLDSSLLQMLEKGNSCRKRHHLCAEAYTKWVS